MNDIIISPSILSADFSVLGEEVDRVARAGADWIHFDVIDGAFAPNLTMGVPLLKSLRSCTNLPIDVHLMIEDPLVKLPWFLEHGPDFVTIHWESLREGDEGEEALKAVELIHSAGAKAGIALKPNLPTGVIDPFLSLWDMVLVMSVFPGFSGQSFIPESAERVAEVLAACRTKGASPLIQVDGGMDEHTAPIVSSLGAQVIVAGNAVFKAPDYRQAIERIRKAAEDARTNAGAAQ